MQTSACLASTGRFALNARGCGFRRFGCLLHLGVVLRVCAENPLDDIFGRFGFCIGFLAGLRPVAGIRTGQFLHQLLSGPGALGGLACRLPLLHDCFAAPLLLGRLASLVVKIALFGVFQKIVGLPDLGESRRRVRVIAIGVRMDGFCLSAPGSLDVFVTGVTF